MTNRKEGTPSALHSMDWPIASRCDVTHNACQQGGVQTQHCCAHSNATTIVVAGIAAITGADAASLAVLTPLKLVRTTQAMEDGGGGGFFLALDQRIEKTDEGSQRIRVFEPKSPKSTVFANVAEAKTDRRMKMGRLGSG